MVADAISRRRFIGGLGATALGAWALAGCSSDRVAAPVALGDPFVMPPDHRSANGRLEVTLVVAAPVPYGTGTRDALTYNGTTPGPTLRVRPGDQLVIHLRNDLDAATNLHTHGLGVSPSGNADNIFVTVAPGATHTYTYDIPSNHRSGMFWYHPHLHGSVAAQVAGGLAGAIVVEDSVDAALPPTTERIWVLSDPHVGGGSGGSMMQQMQGREGDVVLVNGLRQPVVAARGDRLERWRFVNASASRYYRLALDDHPLYVIASDSGRLPAPARVTELLLAPGERAEVLVAPHAPGAHTLRSLAYDRGTGSQTVGPIATIRVTGTGGSLAVPATIVAPTTAPTPTNRRTLTLAGGMGGGAMGGGMGNMGGGMGNGGGMMSFTIDGKTFDGARTDITVAAGTTESWTITNTSAMDHPFHLHAWPFRVVGGPAHQGWKDTVNVPANSSVEIVVPFVGVTGKTVYHCHILDHEDLGMMGVIDVA